MHLVENMLGDIAILGKLALRRPTTVILTVHVPCQGNTMAEVQFNSLGRLNILN